MTAQPMWRNGTIAAILAVLGACASPPASQPATAYEATLPSGPLGNIPRATLRALGNQVSWIGCFTGVRTGWPSGTTAVQICAAQYARDVGRGSTNANGVLVARMVNLGSNVENRWGLTPTDTSFIVAFPGNASQGGYAILEIPRNTFPGTKIRVLLEGGNFIYCPHPPRPAVSSADFNTCEEKATSASHQSGAGEYASGPQASGDAPLFSPDGPAWVSCRTGCCTTDMQ